jgi:hypothetical protein
VFVDTKSNWNWLAQIILQPYRETADAHYKLRTLLIVLAVRPPVIAGVWWAWEAGPNVNAEGVTGHSPGSRSAPRVMAPVHLTTLKALPIHVPALRRSANPCGVRNAKMRLTTQGAPQDRRPWAGLGNRFAVSRSIKQSLVCAEKSVHHPKG